VAENPRGAEKGGEKGEKKPKRGKGRIKNSPLGKGRKSRKEGDGR